MIGSLVRGAVVVGCLSLIIGTAAPSQGHAQATSQIRAVHVATGVPAIDITIGGQTGFTSLAPRSATGYMDLPAGRQAIRITSSGRAQPAVLDTEVELPPNAQLTVALLGEMPSLRVLVLTDDNASPPAGQAKVRFVHGVPDVPPVDVLAGEGSALAGGVGFGGGSAYATVPAGTYTLQLQADADAGPLVSVPNVTLTPGQIVTLFATGKAADNDLVAVPILYQSGGVGTAASGDAAVLPVRMPATGTGFVADSTLGDAAVPLALFVTLAAAGCALALRRSWGR